MNSDVVNLFTDENLLQLPNTNDAPEPDAHASYADKLFSLRVYYPKSFIHAEIGEVVFLIWQ